jgi:Ca2+-binding RTX toxin-like protein
MRNRSIIFFTATTVLVFLVAPASTAATTATCRGRAVTVGGATDGNDVLVGTDGDDVIAGLDGDDTINGRGGNDLICGHLGDDTLFGEDGNDRMFGGSGPGDDQLVGGPRGDYLDGGGGTLDSFGWNPNIGAVDEGGNDTILGRAGFDSIRAGLGNDRVDPGTHVGNVFAGPGDDTVTTLGPTVIEGQEGDDTLLGSADNDDITAGPGVDLVRGFDGNDDISTRDDGSADTVEAGTNGTFGDNCFVDVGLDAYSGCEHVNPF